MTISVIIPALDEEARIGSAIASLRAMGECEVIVVDGGSSDRTLEISAGLADKVISSERGRGTQMLRGAEEAEGDILLFMHADVILPEGAFYIIGSMVSDGRAGAFDIRIDAAGAGYRIIERTANLRSRITRIPYGDQTLCILKKDYERAGRHPAWPLMEDIELGRRLRRAGIRVSFHHSPVRVSPRRWQRHGLIRATLTDWALCTAHLVFRASPERLSRIYYGGR